MKKINLIQNNILNNTSKLALFFGISFYPIYLFDSGSIQVSHYFLITFSVIVLLVNRIPFDKYFFTFLFFLIYCYLVNIFYLYYDMIINDDIKLYLGKNPTIKYLKELLFLNYNFILTISLLTFLSYQKKFNIILYGVAISIFVILVSLLYQFLNEGVEFRFSGYFNNPNQLGYFSICSFSLIYIFYRNLYISYYSMIIALMIIILFSILTLSKAAYVSLFLCIFFAIKPINYRYSKIIEILFFLSLILLFILFFLQISETSIFKRTIYMFYEEDSSLELRGYKVFLEASSLQVLFGMGVKNVFAIHKYEIHSTFLMILTSFGLIGFLIFFALMLFWILDMKKSYGIRGVICICAPSLLYGLTHNGIRFSMFWIMFAVSIYLSKEFIKKEYEKN